MLTVSSSNTERDDFRNQVITITAESGGVRASVSIPEGVVSEPEQLAGLIIEELLKLAFHAGAGK